VAVALAALALFWSRVFRPVSGALERMERAAARLPAERQRLLLEAARLDPLSPEPWIALAQHYEEAWLGQGAPAGSPDFTKACDAARAAGHRDPYRASLHRRLGDLYSQYAHRHRSSQAAQAAAREFAVAAQRHPTSAALWAVLSEARALAGDMAGACHAAAEALRLDAQTPHLDLKLTDAARRELRLRLERECGSSSPRSPAVPP